AVGHPAEGDFAQITGAEHEGLVQIGEAKEMRGAFAGLNVFKGDIVYLLTTSEGMVDVLEHLNAGWADVDFARGDAQGGHKIARVLEGMAAGREAGHGIGEDIFS